MRDRRQKIIGEDTVLFEHIWKTGKGFYDYTVDFSGQGIDEIIRKRDQDLLQRLRESLNALNAHKGGKGQ